ncbi:MAG: hypothetical protein LBQ54_15800 [Planctomycetaceae bacterium]|nr:hypothetical protein [Planctomycetaceae bacterium]
MFTARKISRVLQMGLLICFCLGVSGCNHGKVPLKGKVTFSDDGSPLPTGIVIFSTPTFQARGEIQPDGTFRVSSTGENDGLPPGEYDVNIVNASIAKEGSNSDKPEGWILLVDEKYDSARTSGLKLKVDSKTRNYDLVVDRYVEKKKKKTNT